MKKAATAPAQRYGAQGLGPPSRGRSNGGGSSRGPSRGHSSGVGMGDGSGGHQSAWVFALAENRKNEVGVVGINCMAAH